MALIHTLPDIYPVACHTDHIGVGSIFVAIKGTKYNGNDYIRKAIERGAQCIVIEEDVILEQSLLDSMKQNDVDLMRVPYARRALAELSAHAWGYPARSLKIIGVTGTKGKSTTTFLVEHFLKYAGYKTALLSTVKNRIGFQEFEAPLTTPQPDYLHMFLAQCINADIDYVVMEVAAQAFSLDRIVGIEFSAGAFTNFSQEHAEFYDNLDDYFSAKEMLINHLKPRAPLILNADDERVASLKDQWPTALLVGTSPFARFRCSMDHTARENLAVNLVEGNDTISLESSLLGYFNMYNISMAAAIVRCLGLKWEHIKEGLNSFRGVPGRLERYQAPNGAMIVIDHAHTPSSIEAILVTLRAYSNHLIVVSGAGGDRDKIKRPLMGNLLGHLADMVILTTDNPRSEDPNDIAHDISHGVGESDKHKIIIELDREKAIRRAYEFSHTGSIIALLGKGPDEYQIVQGKKIVFSERRIVQSLI